MPRVPTYDSLQVQPATLPNARVTGAPTTEQASYSGRQMQQVGKAISDVGNTAAAVEVDALERANSLRVADSRNKAKELQYGLEYNQDGGYRNITGVDALNRPDGKPLADEYGDKYQEGLAKITDGLGNDAQKEAFNSWAQESMVGFKGQAKAYEGEQFKTYAMSVQEGTIKNAITDIGTNYNNPVAIDRSIVDIKAAAYEAARMQGKSATFAEAQAKEFTSKAHLVALESAMQKNDPKYADGYLKKYSKDMTADDILKAEGTLTKQMDGQIALETVNKIMEKNRTNIDTPNTERAFNIAVNTESGGKQFGKDGKPLTSSAGAIGIAQVMPATAPEAAKLAGLEWNEEKYKNDADYNRALGKAYFNQQLRDFDGSLAQAYAAYNAGPGRTRQALKDAEDSGQNWIDFLPPETRAYVNKNMAAYESGQGSNVRPTLADIKDQIRTEMGVDKPERLKLALDSAEKQYEDTTKALKQREDETVATAMQEVMANGGNYAGLSPAMRARIPAGEVGKVMDFAKKVAKGDDSTNWATYYQLKSNPKDLASINLMTMRDKFGETEFKELINQQQEIRQGKTDDLTRTRTAKDVLNQYMDQTLGYHDAKDGEEKKAARVGQIWNQYDKQIKAREEATGKKLNTAELNEIAADMFVGKIGINWSTSEYPAAAILPGESIEIPASERQQIVTALTKNGIAATEDAVRNLYLRGKGGGNG